MNWLHLWFWAKFHQDLGTREDTTYSASNNSVTLKSSLGVCAVCLSVYCTSVILSVILWACTIIITNTNSCRWSTKALLGKGWPPTSGIKLIFGVDPDPDVNSGSAFRRRYVRLMAWAVRLSTVTCRQ